MRSFYLSGKTRNLRVRKQALLNMKRFLETEESSALEALHQDLGKSAPEAYLTELAILRKEIQIHLKYMETWARPRRVATPLFLWPSHSKIQKDPYGLVLIMSPWNYPLQLAILPLVGAIAAGNVAVLKCSPLAPQTSAWIHKMVESCFEDSHVMCLSTDTPQADYELNRQLLAQSWDFIFYTGSSAMGKVVMHAAADTLTPLCLELGGKSPCIVDKTANLAIAAKRIVWGKWINAGQTCVAPDYVCVHHSVKDQFVVQLKLALQEFYGSDIRTSPHYSRLVNAGAVLRMQALLKDQKLLFGGTAFPEDRYMEPCLVDEPSWDSPLMQEEIFGPVLPIIGFDSLEQLCNEIALKDKPLALYVFADRAHARYVLNCTTSGGACVNDVVLHLSNPNLPFGGVGHSGMGAYHGKYSFECFSHDRSVLYSSRRFDINFKYPPYKAFAWIKRALQ